MTGRNDYNTVNDNVILAAEVIKVFSIKTGRREMGGGEGGIEAEARGKQGTEKKAREKGGRDVGGVGGGRHEG